MKKGFFILMIMAVMICVVFFNAWAKPPASPDLEDRIAALEAAVIDLQTAVTSWQTESAEQQAEIADLQE